MVSVFISSITPECAAVSQSLCLALAVSDRTVHSVTLTVRCCIIFRI